MKDKVGVMAYMKKVKTQQTVLMEGEKTKGEQDSMLV